MIPATLSHLALLLAAEGEKSKVPFYVVGGVLAAWAVIIGILGLRRADFPGTPARTRAIMGISLVLMLAAVSTAVATSSHPPKHAGAGAGAAANAGTAANAANTVSLAADPSGQLRFNTSQLRAKAGRVTVHFTNQAPLQHNVTIQSKAGKFVAGSATIQGSSTSVTATLTPGTYTYYCSVDSHQQSGMQGTLIVS